MLKGPPQLSVILGPPSSGKTALMKRAISQNFHPDNVLYINLREISFHTVKEFASVLVTSVDRWAPLKSLASRVEVNMPMLGGFSVREEAKSGIEQVDRVFTIMSQSLQGQLISRGEEAPIICFDEANELGSMLDDQQNEGQSAIANLFKFLVANTKETPRFHAVFISSDSFFHNWVNRYISPIVRETYVIGDLCEESAKEFWQQHVLEDVRNKELLNGLGSSPRFEDVFSVCGGRILLMQRYFREFVRRSGNMEPGFFSVVQEEYQRLIRAYHVDVWKKVLHKGQPEWNEEDLIQVCTLFVEGEVKFLDYNLLCETVGSQVVDSLIEHNYLHLRPTDLWAYDLPGSLPGQSVVTPETPAGFVAMKRLLEKIDSSSKS